MKKQAMIVFAVVLCIMALLSGCSKKRTVDATKPHVTITFSYGEGLKYAPTYAVWVEDDKGSRATLFVTEKVAKNNWGLDRASVLPIWSGIREEKVDTVSGATPKSKAKIQCNLPSGFTDKELTLYIEANASFDYNDYYTEGLKSSEEGYSDVNGQPSMLWKAELDPKLVRGEAVIVLSGAGEVMGADHTLYVDLSHVTTAKELITNIVVKFDFIQ